MKATGIIFRTRAKSFSQRKSPYFLIRYAVSPHRSGVGPRSRLLPGWASICRCLKLMPLGTNRYAPIFHTLVAQRDFYYLACYKGVVCHIYLLHGAMPVIMHASTGLQDRLTPRHGDEARSGRFIRSLLKTAIIIPLRKAQFFENTWQPKIKQTNTTRHLKHLKESSFRISHVF